MSTFVEWPSTLLDATAHVGKQLEPRKQPIQDGWFTRVNEQPYWNGAATAGNNAAGNQCLGIPFSRPPKEDLVSLSIRLGDGLGRKVKSYAYDCVVLPVMASY
ncbi:MAG: hypothetical protein IPK82_09965 [Polyangiaceae bacterium]|nr:hypothetical protein [Polyangiaceae bacterium]